MKSFCKDLVVRTKMGLQSQTLNTCKTPKTSARIVCLPMCASESFTVDVAASSGNDEVSNLPIGRCDGMETADSEQVLVIFRMTRVFNGHHLYHVLNNLVVNLDPRMLDRYVFHCWGDWGCPVTFSHFFDKVLNLNKRAVTSGCYENYIFLGENYATYNVSRNDMEKALRWRDWAKIFKETWCPKEILPFDHRYFTLLDRRGAQNGRNLNNCHLEENSRHRYIIPTLDNIDESANIFCNSRLLLSAEGNGLTNMLLLPPNSIVVVIWQNNREVAALRVIYGNMAKLLGMTMIPIPVESDMMLNANCSTGMNQLFDALF